MSDDMNDAGRVWERLAEPLPTSAVSWRADGKPVQRGGKYFARYVCYVEAGTVRERLDSVVPGDWTLALTPLPPLAAADSDGVDQAAAFLATITVCGIARQCVGHGKDYKQAATDAFKRAAVRFGIAHELYDLEQNWVPVDGDGRYAKPLVDPQVNYEQRHGRAASASPPSTASAPAAPDGADNGVVGPACPVCSGQMWDNRLTKRNPKAPDFACRDKGCKGVIWPPRAAQPASPARTARMASGSRADDAPEPEDDGYENDDDLPF